MGKFGSSLLYYGFDNCNSIFSYWWFREVRIFKPFPGYLASHIFPLGFYFLPLQLLLMQVLDLKWVASILNFWFTNCFQEQDMYFQVNLYLLFKSPLPCNREIPRILIYMLSMLESTPKLVKPKLVLKRFDSIHGHVLIFVVIFCSYQEIVCDIKLVGCCLGPHLCWNRHVEVGRWPFRTEDCISFPPLHHWKCWLGCLHCIVIGADAT